MSKQQQWTGERLETFVFNETTIEHLHRYALAIELCAGKKVLDIACGEGYGANLLATKAAHVTGMDIDKAAIEKASLKYKKQNIHFTEATVEKIPVPDHEFDVVVSFETLEHVADQALMIKEIKRVLKPGGILFISTPDKKNYSDKRGYKNPFHVKELYQQEFKTLLQSSFSHIEMYSQQMAYSSIISSATAAGFTSYSGSFDSIKKGQPDEALYYLALASDNELPSLSNSLFNGNSIVEKALEEKEQMVTGTITYRLGHLLLYPFKMIQQLFKK